MRFVNRFAELYQQWGARFEIVKNMLWREYNRMVVPVGPAQLNYQIDKEEARYLLSRFPNALFVRWTGGFMEAHNASEDDWYAVICTEFKDRSDLSANRRYEIQRGLKHCEVKIVDAEFIAKKGFDVFINAFKRYKGTKLPRITEGEYRERVFKTKDFSDIIHWWGVFHNGILIAYSENWIYENIEAAYSTIKFHPDFLNLYPSYALIYT